MRVYTLVLLAVVLALLVLLGLGTPVVGNLAWDVSTFAR